MLLFCNYILLIYVSHLTPFLSLSPFLSFLSYFISPFTFPSHFQHSLFSVQFQFTSISLSFYLFSHSSFSFFLSFLTSFPILPIPSSFHFIHPFPFFLFLRPFISYILSHSSYSFFLSFFTYFSILPISSFFLSFLSPLISGFLFILFISLYISYMHMKNKEMYTCKYMKE